MSDEQPTPTPETWVDVVRRTLQPPTPPVLPTRHDRPVLSPERHEPRTTLDRPKE